MDRLKIEKSGGFVGPGGSNLKRGGEVPLSALSAQDRAWAEALFRNPKDQASAGNIPAFTITLITKDGKSATVKVLESAVPTSIQSYAEDRLK